MGLRILLLTPWENAWIPLYTKVFAERGHQVRVDHDGSRWRKADVFLHMWAGQTEPRPGAVNLMFLRRYEFFDFAWQKYDWSRVDKLIFCNPALKAQFDRLVEADTELVYNAVDLDKWTHGERGPGKKIGMACHIHPKKNLPLAAQIMEKLPGYELHIAGAVQDPNTLFYLQSRKALKIMFYGHVPDMDKWWEDKNYCLSTSLMEGNPNNVNEAMAKGIKPIVHDWPGAEDQYGTVFRTVDEAVAQITGDYGSGYRQHVETRFGLDNFRKVVDMAEVLSKGKKQCLCKKV